MFLIEKNIQFINEKSFQYSFKATDVDTIKRFVEEPKSKNVYVIVAQALNERVPPFILQIYGSNSKFTACDTIRRWDYTKFHLEKYVFSVKCSCFSFFKQLSCKIYF